MGQTREVTVFRYVLQNTVQQVRPYCLPASKVGVMSAFAESSQNVVKLQKKKSGLAKFTLSRADQNVTEALQVSDLSDALH